MSEPLGACRVTTHLENVENLEKSGNFKVVSEKSGKKEKSQGKPGEKICENISVMRFLFCIFSCNSM